MSKQKQRAFLELFEPIRKDLSRFVMAMANSSFDAKDIINETLLIAYENFGQVKEPKAFKSYLFTIASRLYKNGIVRNGRIDYKSELNEDSLISRNMAEVELDVQNLYSALELLPPEQKEAIVLFEISGFKIAEIAEMQNCTESAVKSRLKRGREKLTEILIEKKTIPADNTSERAYKLKVSK